MTVVLVAASGGHLSQLIELADRIDGIGRDRIWVTFDSPQSRSMLAGENTHLIEAIEERDVAGVWRGIGEARRLYASIDATSVISTGSGVALSYLPLAALKGIPTHYIESAARVDKPSLTGRLLSIVPGVRLYRQYPDAAKGRWRFVGSVFDGFERCERPTSSVRRIVVMLGSGVHSFRRLVDRLVDILPRDVEVLWQTGSTPVADLGLTARPLLPADELERAVARADVVISHAGCGSALLALNAGKHPILVPREPTSGELVDGHQIQLAKFLEGRSLALHRSPENLTAADIAATAALAVTWRRTTPPLRLAA